MPLFSTTAQDAALDAMWGVNHATTMPATFEVGLLDGDPRQSGAELAATGGYTRVAVSNDATFWNDADGGVKTSVLTTFAASTDAWSAAAEFWGIWVADELYDFGRLAEPIVVTAAGDGPAIRIKVRFNKELI